MNVPAVIGKTLLPCKLTPFHIQDLLRMEDQVKNGLEAGMAEFPPMPDALHELIEVVIE